MGKYILEKRSREPYAQSFKVEALGFFDTIEDAKGELEKVAEKYGKTDSPFFFDKYLCLIRVDFDTEYFIAHND